MKALLVLPLGLALLAMGVAIGHQMAAAPGEPESPAAAVPEAEVVVRTATGDVRSLTPAAAADRIERLERTLASRKSREEASETEPAEPSLSPTSSGDPPVQGLTRPDGTPYSADEIRDLARTPSADPALRRAAIQHLRRADTDEARAVLQEVLADATAPSTVREEAARALATQPNRDKLPEELLTALEGESDTAVRLALAQGIGRMNGREAWMTEIVAIVHGEKDPETRKALFDAVVRDARDPVARDELLAIAVDPASAPDERRAALAALPRGRTDPAIVERVASLLADADPRIRESAVAFVGAAQAISMDALSAALADDDAGVRRAALAQGLQRLPQFGNDKTIDKAAYQTLVDTSVRLASADPDPTVRRAAIQQIGSLPKAIRDQVLETGRSDPDLYVKLTSYARSSTVIAKEGTPLYLGALESPDAGLRDFAYRQLQRVEGVSAPFDTRWNAKARAAAITRIRQDMAAGGR